MQKNLTSIVTGLRTATHSHVPIFGMNYYDPLLGDWLAGPGPTRTLALASIGGVATLNKDMTAVYTKANTETANSLCTRASLSARGLAGRRFGNGSLPFIF